MTERRKKQLKRELFAYAMEQGDALRDTPKNILQEITNDVIQNISPISPELMPFYIAAFEGIAQSLRAQFSDAAVIADDLKREMKFYSIALPHRKNK